MTVNIDDRYLAADRIDDALGSGIRLYTDRDEVYETRDITGHAVRIAGGDPGWYTQVHLPAPDEPREAYDPFDTVAERIDTAYDTELITPATTFLEHMAEEDRFHVEDTDAAPAYSLQYRRELEPDPHEEFSEVSNDILVGYVGAGAASGGATALALGAADPFLGLVSGMAAGSLGALLDKELYTGGSSLSPARNIRRGVNAVKRTVAGDDDGGVEELAGVTVWDRLNEKRRLETVAEETRDVEEAERYLELKDTDIEVEAERLLLLQFESFEDQRGITAAATVEAYDDAINFAATVLDRETPDTGRPSIYTDADVFDQMFAAVPQEEQERLVEPVLEGDAAEPVESYLNAEHTELVQAVGSEHALEGGADG